MTYEHQDWPRDLIHKESGKRQEFKRPEDVPPGWFTVDGDEVNPAPHEIEDDPASPPQPEPLAEVKTRRRKPSEKVGDDGN